MVHLLFIDKYGSMLFQAYLFMSSNYTDNNGDYLANPLNLPKERYHSLIIWQLIILTLCQRHLSQMKYFLILCNFAHHFQSKYFPEFCRLGLLWRHPLILEWVRVVEQSPDLHMVSLRTLQIKYLIKIFFILRKTVIYFN